MSAPQTAQAMTGLSRRVELPLDGNFSDREERGRWCAEQLEAGNILFFPAIPFEFPDEWREFLLAQRQTGARYHKNIAYRPAEDRLTGLADRAEAEQMRAVLRSYSNRAFEFLADLLPGYKRHWKRDFASFRPFEERGRDLRLRARNDLLHTDAFPTRPTRGDRILRFFTNLNPTEPRVWVTGPTFEALAERLAPQAGLPQPAAERSVAVSWLLESGRRLGRALRILPPERSPYDEFMLRFHNFLKENEEFQRDAPRVQHEFPPDSCWAVFTDMASHAALSGRYALEQTFIVARDALACPERAPVSILERICGRPLASL